MCGIAGAVGTEGSEVVSKMLAALRHRGPDSERVDSWSLADGRWASLGHARLSIIDLSSTANQPFVSTDRSVGVAVNGEIYNFESIRGEFGEAAFRSRSDCEVCLPLWIGSRELSPARLDGMFAVAVWDGRSETLALFRDPMGEKPLFFAEWDGGIAFASEIPALLRHPRVSDTVDPRAIAEYLAFNYIAGPQTVCARIQRVLPGELVLWSKGKLSRRRYSAGPAALETTLVPEDLGEATLEFENRLRASVRSMLVSDVPLGLLLSGGMDSSAILALASADVPGLKTFSIVFPQGGTFEERAYSRFAANRFGTEHRELVVDQTSLEVLPNVLRNFGQPFGFQASLVSYLISGLARQHVKVVLGGVGGDELLGGYPRHIATKWAAAIDAMPRELREAVAWLAQHAEQGERGTSWARVVSQARTLGHPAAARYVRALASGSVEDVESRLGPVLRDSGVDVSSIVAARVAELQSLAARRTLLGATLAFDQRAWLADCLLEYSDRTSMAHALEVRSPFLARDVVAFANAAPDSMKVSRRRGKLLLRNLLLRHYPREFVHRRKVGFGAPLSMWFESGSANFVRDTLSAARIRAQGLLSPGYVERLLTAVYSGKRSLQNELFSVLALTVWHDQHIQATQARSSR